MRSLERSWEPADIRAAGAKQSLSDSAGCGRHWYRYQALFADALRYRLEQSLGEEVSSLHLKASRWYAERGST